MANTAVLATIAGTASSERRSPAKMSPRNMNSSNIGAAKIESKGIQMFADNPRADSHITSCSRSKRRKRANANF